MAVEVHYTVTIGDTTVTLTRSETMDLYEDLQEALGFIEEQVVEEGFDTRGYQGAFTEDATYDGSPPITPDEALARIQAQAQASQHDHMQRNPGSGIGSRNA